MEKFAAFVKDRETKKWIYMEREYETAKDFKTDLACNGYMIRHCCPVDKYEEVCEKWHEQNERNKCIKRTIRETNKRLEKSADKRAERLSQMSEEKQAEYRMITDLEAYKNFWANNGGI